MITQLFSKKGRTRKIKRRKNLKSPIRLLKLEKMEICRIPPKQTSRNLKMALVKIKILVMKTTKNEKIKF